MFSMSGAWHMRSHFLFVPIQTACTIPFSQFLLSLFELVPPSVISCDTLAICHVRMISLLYLVPANQVSCILCTQLPNSLVSFTPSTLFN